MEVAWVEVAWVEVAGTHHHTLPLVAEGGVLGVEGVESLVGVQTEAGRPYLVAAWMVVEAVDLGRGLGWWGVAVVVQEVALVWMVGRGTSGMKRSVKAAGGW